MRLGGCCAPALYKERRGDASEYCTENSHEHPSLAAVKRQHRGTGTKGVVLCVDQSFLCKNGILCAFCHCDAVFVASLQLLFRRGVGRTPSNAVLRLRLLLSAYNCQEKSGCCEQCYLFSFSVHA